MSGRRDPVVCALRAVVVVFTVFMLAPILVVVALSFTSAGFVAFPMPGLSLRWFARIVEYRILKNGRRALLFIGCAHISLTVIFTKSLIHMLDSSRPGETIVVSVLYMGSVTPQVAARLRQWPVGGAARFRVSWYRIMPRAS